MKNEKAKSNASTAAASSSGTSLNDIFRTDGNAEDPQIIWLAVDNIVVLSQVREEFENEEESLADLASSIKKHGLLQPILVRPSPGGFGQYELIAGERRVRAHKLARILTIPAYVKDMDDETALDAQFAENIHRKNLTQIEEAKKIQRDLDKLGSVNAVLEKYQKSRSWLSKIIGLLDLPEQSRRLVSESISADVEVINQVKTIEKIDREEARRVVDKLGALRGRVDARNVVAEAKERVKPTGKTVVLRKEPTNGAAPAVPHDAMTPGLEFATSKSKSAQQPGPVVSSKAAFADAPPVTLLLQAAYTRLNEQHALPEDVLHSLAAKDIAEIEDYLASPFRLGLAASDAQSALPTLLAGMRTGSFGGEGHAAFAFVAYFQGLEKYQALDLRAVFEYVRIKSS